MWRHQNSEIDTVHPSNLFFSHIPGIKSINPFANFGIDSVLLLEDKAF